MCAGREGASSGVVKCRWLERRVCMFPIPIQAAVITTSSYIREIRGPSVLPPRRSSFPFFPSVQTDSLRLLI